MMEDWDSCLTHRHRPLRHPSHTLRWLELSRYHLPPPVSLVSRPALRQIQEPPAKSKLLAVGDE